MGLPGRVEPLGTGGGPLIPEPGSCAQGKSALKNENPRELPEEVSEE